jgi:hypothetical protein
MDFGASTELLDMYESVSDNLPLVLKYENPFHAKPHRIRVLSLMYKDILDFHQLALAYFRNRS